jgi:hypothetical protein
MRQRGFTSACWAADHHQGRQGYYPTVIATIPQPVTAHRTSSERYRMTG